MMTKNRVYWIFVAALWALALGAMYWLYASRDNLLPFLENNAGADTLVMPLIVLFVFAVSAVAAAYFSRLGFLIAIIFLSWASFWYLWPVLQYDKSGYPIDTDEYDDWGMAACQKKTEDSARAECLHEAALRIQKLVRETYDEQKNKPWIRQTFEQWQHSADAYCRARIIDETNKDRAAYLEQKCLYDVSHQESLVLRELAWQEQKSSKND